MREDCLLSHYITWKLDSDSYHCPLVDCAFLTFWEKRKTKYTVTLMLLKKYHCLKIFQVLGIGHCDFH